MRESALKSAIFVGVPRVSEPFYSRAAGESLSDSHQTILSLAALSDALEDDVKAGLRQDSRR